MNKGLLLAAYGLGGVFSSLIVFYIVVRILVIMFPQKENEEGGVK